MYRLALKVAWLLASGDIFIIANLSHSFQWNSRSSHTLAWVICLLYVTLMATFLENGHHIFIHSEEPEFCGKCICLLFTQQRKRTFRFWYLCFLVDNKGNCLIPGHIICTSSIVASWMAVSQGFRQSDFPNHLLLTLLTWVAGPTPCNTGIRSEEPLTDGHPNSV